MIAALKRPTTVDVADGVDEFLVLGRKDGRVGDPGRGQLAGVRAAEGVERLVQVVSRLQLLVHDVRDFALVFGVAGGRGGQHALIRVGGWGLTERDRGCDGGQDKGGGAELEFGTHGYLRQ